MQQRSPFTDTINVFVTPSELREIADRFDVYLQRLKNIQYPFQQGLSVMLPQTEDRQISFIISLDLARASLEGRGEEKLNNQKGSTGAQ